MTPMSYLRFRVPLCTKKRCARKEAGVFFIPEVPKALPRPNRLGYMGQMLKVMRESSQSFIIYVMFGMLVFVFAVSFGPGSGSCGKTTVDYAAIVDGDIIQPQEFGTTYQNQLEYMRRLRAYGGAFDNEALQKEIRQQVIDQLIETRLLAHEANRLGLTASDQELLEFLKLRYGVDQYEFSEWEMIVNRRFGTTVPKFEQRMRGQIVANTLRRVIRDNVAISDDELKETFMREHDRAMVTFVRFDPNDAAAATVATEAQIDELLAKDPEAVKAAYDKDLFRYRTPKQVKARHILKKLPAESSDAEVAKARGALLEIKSQIEGGADFAALAKTVSEDDATKDKGGDLGFIGRGDKAGALVDALFAMKTDDVSADPVRSDDGLHLLQVTQIQPPARKPFDEVKRETARDLLAERARDEGARAQAEAFQERLRAGGDLEAITWTREEEREKRDEAKEAGRALTNTQPVRADTPWILASQKGLPGIGDNDELHAAIFAATQEEPLIENVHKVGRYYFVARLKEREKPDLTQFDDQKDTLRDQALAGKRNEVFRAWVKHLRKKAEITLNPQYFPTTGAALPNAG